jgi:hypothetical protein
MLPRKHFNLETSILLLAHGVGIKRAQYSSFPSLGKKAHTL